MLRTATVVIILSWCLPATGVAADRYEPTWESLRQFSVSEWYQDAKFGILHWGVFSVPAYGNERYPRNMYI